jgi:predicted dehydrogenase
MGRMSTHTLRVGLAGAGPWARRVHAAGIAAHPRTTLTAVWARRAEAAAEVAEPHGATSTTDFDELLSQVDAVAFAVPPAAQAPLATKAANAGKHIILEKPVASSVREAEPLVDAVTRANVTSMVVFTFRFDASTRAWLHAVHQVDDWEGGLARWFSGTLLDANYEHSRWRHDGGALADIGPHVFDLLDAALGPVKTVEQARLTGPGLWHIMLGHDGGRLSTATLSMHTPTQPAITDFAVHGPHGFLPFNASGPATERYAVLLDDFTRLVEHNTTEHPLDVRRGLHIQRVLGLVVDEVNSKRAG